ncbi:MAG: Co2+/Mg2+ efflux protein ApaG, partial [Thiohalocapsa sp.]
MPDAEPYRIEVNAVSDYIAEQSDPQDNRFVFAYTITIRNTGSVPAKLLNRHWIVTDANGKVQEVRGAGVVGEQPHLNPGEAFRYTSGTQIA